MILNLHSLAFGTETASGGGTPAWGTEMGQGEGYRFNFNDYADFITAMVYNSIQNPKGAISCPLGKGGNKSDDYEFVVGSLFNKVFVNGIKVDGKFLLLIVKKMVGAHHVGRRTLKYNPHMTLNGVNYNEDCYKKMATALGVSPEGSWFVSQINVRHQDELHFTAHILNANTRTVFEDSNDRTAKLQQKLLAFAQETNDSNMKKYIETLALNFPLQQIYFGAPGTGKSHEINMLCAKHENYRTTFHPDTDYASFVGSYKPITELVPRYTYMGAQAIAVKDEEGKPIIETKISYRYVFQSFLKAYVAAWKEQMNEVPKPVFLIIEEINRGNCAQIFGDIFQLLDRNAAGFSDYPIVADDDLAKELKREFAELSIVNSEGINNLYEGGKDVVGSVLKGEKLLLPNNMFIWATMNTSDQSLFPIDSAFKRRWDWKYVKIKNADEKYKISFSNGHEYDWWAFVDTINKRIEGGEIQQEDKKLGYFFVKAKEQSDKKIITAEAFLSKVIFYLYNDVFKDFGFEEDFFKDSNGEIMTFASYFNENGDVNENQVEQFIRNLGLTYEGQDTQENNEIEESQENKAKIIVGNVATSLRQTLYEITKQAIEINSDLTFKEIKEASSVINRSQPLFLTDDEIDAWKEEHANDNSSSSRYLFDKPLQASGISFVVLSQWGYLESLKDPFTEYAKKLGVEIKFGE